MNRHHGVSPSIPRRAVMRAALVALLGAAVCSAATITTDVSTADTMTRAHHSQRRFPSKFVPKKKSAKLIVERPGFATGKRSSEIEYAVTAKKSTSLAELASPVAVAVQLSAASLPPLRMTGDVITTPCPGSQRESSPGFLTPVQDVPLVAPQQEPEQPIAALERHALTPLDTLALRIAILKGDVEAVESLGERFGSIIYDSESVHLASMEPTGYMFADAFCRRFPLLSSHATKLLRISANKQMYESDWLLDIDSIPQVRDTVLLRPTAWDAVLQSSETSSSEGAAILMHMLEMIDDRVGVDISVVFARAWLRGDKRIYDAVCSRTDGETQIARALPLLAKVASLDQVFNLFCTFNFLTHSLGDLTAHLQASALNTHERRLMLFLAFQGALDLRSPSMAALHAHISALDAPFCDLVLSACARLSDEEAYDRTMTIMPDSPLY